MAGERLSSYVRRHELKVGQGSRVLKRAYLRRLFAELPVAQSGADSRHCCPLSITRDALVNLQSQSERGQSTHVADATHQHGG
jgi:hypothetical protein